MNFYLNNEDLEDYEQEKRIQEWLKKNNLESEFEFSSINSKGNAKHVGDIGSFSLDQQISDESGSSSFAEIIEGENNISIIQDIEEEEEKDFFEISTECCLEILLTSLGIKRETRKWATQLYTAKITHYRETM